MVQSTPPGPQAVAPLLVSLCDSSTCLDYELLGDKDFSQLSSVTARTGTFCSVWILYSYVFLRPPGAALEDYCSFFMAPQLGCDSCQPGGLIHSQILPHPFTVLQPLRQASIYSLSCSP